MRRDELAAVLDRHVVIDRGTHAACLCGRFIADMDTHPMGDYDDDHRDHVADAVLAWLGEQFDEGLRTDVMLGIAGTQKPCRKAIRANGGCVTDFGPCLCVSEAHAALAVVRERLGLSEAAQDAQDGAVGPGSVRMGTGEGAAPNGAQIEDFQGER